MLYSKLSLKNEYPFLGENNADPYLECYLPTPLFEMNRGDEKRPCILICPGGGYEFCSRREAEPIALRFIAAGYNAFILTYSVVTYRFPTQLREVAAAIETIYSHADEWHCDTGKIAIAGFSAGGHLAAHYSTSYNCAEVREVFPDSKPVNASILCYPVITSKPGLSHEGSFRALCGNYPLTAVQTLKVSCERLVTKNTPPAFIWHTSEDSCVPVINSLLYAEHLSENKIPFSLHIYPFGGHGLATADSETNGKLEEKVSLCSGWIDEAVKWLSFTLK